MISFCIGLILLAGILHAKNRYQAIVIAAVFIVIVIVPVYLMTGYW